MNCWSSLTLQKMMIRPNSKAVLTIRKVTSYFCVTFVFTKIRTMFGSISSSRRNDTIIELPINFLWLDALLTTSRNKIWASKPFKIWRSIKSVLVILSIPSKAANFISLMSKPPKKRIAATSFGVPNMIWCLIFDPKTSASKRKHDLFFETP